MDSYVTEALFGGRGVDKLRSIVGAVKKIRVSVMGVKRAAGAADVSRMKALNEKLERCRNQDNNPDSQS